MPSAKNILRFITSDHVAAPHSHYRVLDGLRAIAILLVILMHSLREERQVLHHQILPVFSMDLASFVYNGWIGVYLFFVLSGFLIGTQLIKITGQPPQEYKESLLRYIKVRFFRIAPAYYVTLPLLVTYHFMISMPVEGLRLADYFQPQYGKLLIHTIFMYDYFPPLQASYLWSLAIEIKFYLLAPFLLLLIFRMNGTKARILSLLLFATILVAVRMVTVLNLPDSFHGQNSYFFLVQSRFHVALDCLLAGLMCALLWHDEKIRGLISNPKMANTLLLIGALILIYTAGLRNITYPLDTFVAQVFMPTKLAAGFSLIMLGLLGQCYGYRFFENRVFRFIALISYSLYLTHVFCLWIQNAAIKKMAGVEHLQDASLLYWLGTLPLYIVTSFIVATILYYLIEKPFINWSKK